MDPTLQAPVSPYAAAMPSPGPGGVSPAQLQAIITALKSQGAAGGTDQSSPAAAGTAGQQQQGMPYSGAGNMIKGLMSPPPTSILGQTNNAVFGQNAPLMAALGGPQYGGSSFGAFGGSSANPLPGLSASDYGAGF